MAIPALAVSVSYLVLTALLAAALRRVVCRLLEQPLLRRLALEAVAAAELCGCCFELIIVADNYGVWAYAAFLFLLTVWWSSNWGDATACPYTHLEDVLEGRSDVLTALLITGAELAGGVYVFRYIQYLWDLELAETHVDKAWQECTADLQKPSAECGLRSIGWSECGSMARVCGSGSSKRFLAVAAAVTQLAAAGASGNQ